MEIVQSGIDMWPWCMSMIGARFAVFVRRARVLPGPCPATRNLSFLRFHRRRHTVVSTHNFHWDGTGWCENSTRWKSCKPVQARDRGAWACLTHGLQCLCDERERSKQKETERIRSKAKLISIQQTKEQHLLCSHSVCSARSNADSKDQLNDLRMPPT